jgi:hypothetical protein
MVTKVTQGLVVDPFHVIQDAVRRVDEASRLEQQISDWLGQAGETFSHI